MIMQIHILGELSSINRGNLFYLSQPLRPRLKLIHKDQPQLMENMPLQNVC